MQKKENSAHEFALLWVHLPPKVAANTIVHLKDDELIHRIRGVLRLEVGDAMLLFNDECNARVVIESIEKRQISVRLLSFEAHPTFLPEIHWFVPPLERSAFEEVLTDLCVMGATSITPLLTKKSRHKVTVDPERATRIMVAAAEQSKQFRIPLLKAPISFDDMVQELNKKRESVNELTFFCDPDGRSALDQMNQLAAVPPEVIRCIVGPEGDLTDSERVLLHAAGVKNVSLTPTVLRAETAVTVFMGLLRSCVKPRP
ncbi:TPA: hypothetical protein DDZ86_00185 [Candidatus Dependentiae bacterium]|nr:MAG: Ribosomal RNA small subunit methyltransferase E [candidate division TM6 bacterium GW2011_GWF2_43_87]HBL98046.1 hypothetical protein [Candidatus Dependentiae bacterium]